MFKHELPDELIAFRDVIRKFVQSEIVPLEPAARHADLTELPAEQIARLQRKARGIGLWCFETPQEYGGAGLDSFQLAVLMEEASRHTYSLPDAGNGAFGYDPPNILFSGTPEQIERYVRPSVDGAVQWAMGISEPAGGSDPARSIRTRAVRTADGWLLNGRKMWTSRADVGQHMIVFARTSQGRNGISAFIVPLPCPGVTVRPVKVIRDHHTTEVTLEDVLVPEADLLGEPGQGFALAQRWLNRGRIRIATQSIGVAQLALDMACEYAGERHTFGAALATRQMVQQLLVDGQLGVNAARLVLWEAASRDAAGLDAREGASAAKVMCTEAGYQAVDAAIQVFGGMGVARELPLERWLRGLRVTRIVEGPSEIHRMVLARSWLGGGSASRPAAEPVEPGGTAEPAVAGAPRR